MPKKVKVLSLALTSDTGVSSTDGVTNDGHISVAPISGADTIWYRTQLDAGTWSPWIQATKASIPAPSADGAWLVEVEERAKKGAVVDSKSLSFTLDTSADKDVAATLAVSDPLVNDVEKSAVNYSVSGLDSDATALVTVTDGTHSATHTYGANGAFDFDLTGFNDGVISSSMRITDLAGNAWTTTGASTTLDTSVDAGTGATLAAADTLVNDAEKGAVSYIVSGLDTNASALVSVTDGTHTATHTYGANGAFDFNLAGFNDGLISSSMLITDVAGNTKTITGSSTTLDTSADTGMAATLAVADGLVNNLEKGAVRYGVSGLDSDASALVTVTDGTGSATHSYGANGTFDFDLSGFGDGAITASMLITDAAGNTKTALGDSTTLDTSADTGSPATLGLADTLVNNLEKTAVSYTVAGLDPDVTSGGVASAIFTSSGGGQKTVGLSANGTFLIDLSALLDGTITTSLSFADAAGNSKSVAGASTLLDTQVAVPTVQLLDDTGKSHSDGITKVAALSVAGIEPGATTDYSTDGGKTWSGSFAAVEGENQVLVRQTDLAGNISGTGSLNFTLDTIAPVVQDDYVATPQNTPITVDVLSNDGVPPPPPDSITKFDPAAYGSLLSNADGTFTYTPNAGSIGADSFHYTVGDAAGNSAVGTVYVEIYTGTPGGNSPPVVEAPLNVWAPSGGAPVMAYALQNVFDADPLDTLTVVNLPPNLPTGVTYDATTSSFIFDPTATSQATVSYGVSDGTATVATLATFAAGNSPFVAYDPQVHNNQALIDALIPGASGVSVDAETIALTAGATSVNFYDGTLAPLGIGPGLLITSGTTPAPMNTMTWFGQDNAMPGDPALDAVVNTVFHTQPNSYDATTFSFSFTVDPTATSVSFDLVFGSDEYPEWVDQYVDCAIVLVNGVNVALFGHDPLHPLSVITPNLDAGYFVDNGPGQLPIEYDGISHPLKIVAPVHQSLNTVTIGVGDTGDHILDSGLFIANLTAGDAPGSGVVIPVPVPPPSGGGGGSSVTGSAQDEYFDMTEGNDTVYCGAGDDIVLAKGGNDLVFGEDGEDAVNGGAGMDTLSGGSGADELVGGSDKDVLTGGSGADVFKYKEIENWAANPSDIDQITDFGDGAYGNQVVLDMAHDLYDIGGIDGDILLFSMERLTHMPGYVANPDWTLPSAETYSTLGAAALSNTGAATSDGAQFVYDPGAGVLSYDPDGVGAAAAFEVVMLGQGPHPISILGTNLVVEG